MFLCLIIVHSKPREGNEPKVMLAYTYNLSKQEKDGKFKVEVRLNYRKHFKREGERGQREGELRLGGEVERRKRKGDTEQEGTKKHESYLGRILILPTNNMPEFILLNLPCCSHDFTMLNLKIL